MTDSRAEFEAWYIARQRSNGFGDMLTDAEFLVKHDDGRYRSCIGLDVALEAYQAARKAALEEAASLCDQRSIECKGMTEIEWTASECAKDIRSLAERSPT